MPYRPRFTIYTPTKRLRWPRAWDVLSYWEEYKRRSEPGITQVWQQGRKHIKRVDRSPFGWSIVRLHQRTTRSICQNSGSR